MSGDDAVLLMDAAESEVEDLSPIAGPVLRMHQRCFILAPVDNGEWRRLSGSVTCLSASQFCAAGRDGIASATTWESQRAVLEFLETFPDEAPQRDSTIIVRTDLFGLFAVQARHLDRMQNYGIGQIIIVRELEGRRPRLAIVRRVTGRGVRAEYAMSDGAQEVTRTAFKIARFERQGLSAGKIRLSPNKVLITWDGRPLCVLEDEWTETTWPWFLLGVIFGPLVLPLFHPRPPSGRARVLFSLAWGITVSFLASQVVWAIVFLNQRSTLQHCQANMIANGAPGV
jgi:hypothetical protein